MGFGRRDQRDQVQPHRPNARREGRLPRPRPAWDSGQRAEQRGRGLRGVALPEWMHDR